MIKIKSLLVEMTYDTNIWYHGSASGDLRGGKTGLHLGTYKAAKEALEATIGIPVEGEWDGKRLYGETLLCGDKTLKSKNIFPTGFNCDVPEYDFYPDDDFSPIKEWRRTQDYNYKLSNRPAIKAYKILCPITNMMTNPYNDAKANGYMKGLLKSGRGRNGFYYKNDAEDYGSISVVVPNGSCVKEV